MSLTKGNYYVIQSFMTTELGLKGIDKEIYAIVWGFSQGENTFNGSLSYLEEITGYSRPTVVSSLKKLVKKGLLVKKDIFRDGQKFCVYRALASENKAEGSKMELKIDFDYQMAKDSASSEADPFALCGSKKTKSDIDKLYEQTETITKEQFAIQRAMLMEKLGGK